MKKITKNKAIPLIIVLSIVVGICGLLGYSLYENYIKQPQYITNNVADYRKVKGTVNKGEVEELLDFFPYKIQDNFKDVSYSFKAEKCGVYSFEAYLEFTIDDKEAYHKFVKSSVKWRIGQPFSYDPQYTEYIVSDVIQPDFSTEALENNKPVYQGNVKDFDIRYCDVRKILCNDEEQRVIFVAICVDNKGFTNTDFYCTFFDRFNINPREYAPPRYHYYRQ